MKDIILNPKYLLVSGKTKDVYGNVPMEYDPDGTCVLLHFKNAITGHIIKKADGTKEVVPDSGGNEVVGTVENRDSQNLISSAYYFELFEKAGLKTHYVIHNLEEKTMIVKKAEVLGKNGIEVITRPEAEGSILRIYPEYVERGQKMPDFIQFTTKNDATGDPTISEELMNYLNIMAPSQIYQAKKTVFAATNVIAEDLKKLGLTLIDIKFELGVIDEDIIIIDEVSSGIMRVRYDELILTSDELADILVTREVPTKEEIYKNRLLKEQDAHKKTKVELEKARAILNAQHTIDIHRLQTMGNYIIPFLPQISEEVQRLLLEPKSGE